MDRYGSDIGVYCLVLPVKENNRKAECEKACYMLTFDHIFDPLPVKIAS